MTFSALFRAAVITAAVSTCPMLANAQDAPQAPPADPQAVANTIALEVAQIRGVPLKQSVKVEHQSAASFQDYVSHRIGEVVPQSVQQNYGTLVRTLGLYRGPAINFSATMGHVLGSQVAAYYDPKKQSFFVVMSGMPEMMQGALYAHELYHALQDQRFGLNAYMQDKDLRDTLGSDAMLARQAVVEGEATYMMSLWLVQKMTHAEPTRQMMTKVVEAQTSLTIDRLREALKQSQMAQLVGKDVQAAVESADNIPPFIMDLLMGSYLKGLGFVFAVQEQGWPAVDQLYTEYPPRSMEQILHPEKWRAREEPVTFEWPRFDKVRALHDWELLGAGVLGEFQMRIIFKEHGLASEAESVAAGWGGDRYAVFKRKDSDATLLLLRTSWDTDADAKEFVAAYQRLLAVKYADAPAETRIEQKGLDVFVVEGSERKDIDSLLKLVKQVKRKRT
jgi:hypothetical protein